VTPALLRVPARIAVHSLGRSLAAAAARSAPGPRPAVLTGERPRTHRETHTVFFDYHASRRAFLDEDDSGCTDQPEDEAPPPAETPSRPVPAYAEGW
jgi:hypothetical protein